MSSAILYLAIVAIWAGVLIPRWLRRDSSSARQEPEASGVSGSEATPAPATVADEPEPTRGGEDVATRPAAPPAPTARTGPPRTARGPARDSERKRVLAARRRLLWMLMALAIGSGGLAVTGMAAWWVMVPPAIMMFGYLILLREAAKADAERRALAARRERELSRVRPVRSARPAAPPRPALVPTAEIIDLPSSNAASEDREALYDQYADAKLRAVGD